MDEKEEIRLVVEIAKRHGFGNLIAVLRKEWADILMKKIPNITRKHADDATINAPYKKKWW